MKIDDLARQPSPWLQNEGNESDVVIFSKVRLARNIDGYSFVGRATAQDLENLMTVVCGTFAELFDPSKVTFVDFSNLHEDDTQFLFERRFIRSPAFETEVPRGLLFDNRERFSVVVNDDDHLRIQAIASGLALKTVYERADSLDDQLEAKLDFSFDDQYGYLTASPCNLGTGMCASVALHLPALVETGDITKAARGLQKLNFEIRGFYSGDEQKQSDFFIVNTQRSLGVTEEETIEQMHDVIVGVVNYERQARETILSCNRRGALDRCRRALGVLHMAQTTSLEEATTLLSDIRLGIALEFFNGAKIPLPDQLLLQIQPASLARLVGRDFDDEEDENATRAEFLSSMLPNEG